jgi:plastocyanin
MQSILGARTAADVNLAAQLLLLAGLIVGFFLARQKRFDQHGNVQTAMVLFNLILIAFIMVPSFYGYVIAGGSTTGRVAQLMIVHGLLGIAIQIVALYLVLRMRTRVIPKALRVANVKPVMRTTLAVWAILVALGVGIYGERYLNQRAVVTAPLAEFRQLGADLYVHAVELDDAVKRSSAPAVKRHAEHLINLIEGKDGLHYGDNDTDGHLEDPGDGVGLLARLDAVAVATNDPAVTTHAAAVRGELQQIVERSTEVLGPQPVAEHAATASEIVDLARQANGEGVFEIELAAAAAGVAQAPGMMVDAGSSGEPSSVTVHEVDFAFMPGAMTIPAGTTVIWANDERPKHTATADDGLFDSGDQSLGDTYSYTFSEPGTYPYFCRYHGDVGGVGMAGTITVE